MAELEPHYCTQDFASSSPSGSQMCDPLTLLVHRCVVPEPYSSGPIDFNAPRLSKIGHGAYSSRGMDEAVAGFRPRRSLS
jgi:hypothetical protein